MTVFTIFVCAVIGLLLMISVDNLLSTVLSKLAGLCRLPSNRWVNWSITGVAAVVAPFAAFVLLACGTAVVVPPPQEFTYATIDIAPEATFYQRNVAWVALKTGYADVKVEPGLIYSRAYWKVSDTETKEFVGLPGVGKWYSL